MVRVRVVETDDIQPQSACLPLNLDQLLRSDVVAVVRGVGARITSPDNLVDMVARAALVLAEQNAAALMRIGLLPMRAQRLVLVVVNP
jgi:hypothetical protein